MSLPFGAALSTGITHTTTSPGSIRSPTTVGSVQSFGAYLIIVCFSSSIPSPVKALTNTAGSRFFKYSFLPFYL